jgi:hypothetical protein
VKHLKLQILITTIISIARNADAIVTNHLSIAMISPAIPIIHSLV